MRACENEEGKMKINLMDTDDPAWKRMWKRPRTSSKAVRFNRLFRGRYLADQSLKRFLARNDVKTVECANAIGRIDRFTLFTSKNWSYQNG